MLVTALCGACVLSACAVGATDTHDPLAKLNSAISRLNQTRRAVISDLEVLTRAFQSADAADKAASTGDVASATTLVPTAVSLTASAAPIAARGRSDVVLYEQALSEIGTAIAKLGPTDGITDYRSDAVEAVVRVGNAEAAAVKASVHAYATAWPDFSALTELQRTWLQRIERGDTSTGDAASTAYITQRADSIAAFSADSARIATAERVRAASTSAMATALAQARGDLAGLPLAPFDPSKFDPSKFDPSKSVQPAPTSAS